MDTKRCSECGRMLPVGYFYLRRKDIPGWYQNKCKVCKKLTDGIYRKTKAQKRKEVEDRVRKAIADETYFSVGIKLLSGAEKSALKTLGLTDSANADDVKRAFKVMARTTHPDAGGKQEDFIKIKEAYELLSSKLVIR